MILPAGTCVALRGDSVGGFCLRTLGGIRPSGGAFGGEESSYDYACAGSQAMPTLKLRQAQPPGPRIAHPGLDPVPPPLKLRTGTARKPIARPKVRSGPLGGICPSGCRVVVRPRVCRLWGHACAEASAGEAGWAPHCPYRPGPCARKPTARPNTGSGPVWACWEEYREWSKLVVMVSRV
jgi:hypothetical protein